MKIRVFAYFSIKFELIGHREHERRSLSIKLHAPYFMFFI